MDKNQIYNLNQHLFAKLARSKLKEQPEVEILNGFDFFSDIDSLNNSFSTIIKSKLSTNMVKIVLDRDQNVSIDINISDNLDASILVECMDTFIKSMWFIQKLMENIIKSYNEEFGTTFELKSSYSLELGAAKKFLNNTDEDEVENLYRLKEVERGYFELWVANSKITEIKNSFTYPAEGFIIEGLISVIYFLENGENKPFKIK
jgi:hypothetical protein